MPDALVVSQGVGCGPQLLGAEDTCCGDGGGAEVLEERVGQYGEISRSQEESAPRPLKLRLGAELPRAAPSLPIRTSRAFRSRGELLQSRAGRCPGSTFVSRCRVLGLSASCAARGEKGSPGVSL